MKTTILRTGINPNLVIPAASVAMAELDQESKLEARLDEGVIVIMPSSLTAIEAVAVIDTLSEVSEELIQALVAASGECEDCFACEDATGKQRMPDCCADCTRPCAGAEIPQCVLEEASINPRHGLEFEAFDGEIHIREIPEQDLDIMELLPGFLKDRLQAENVCARELRELFDNGVVVYGR